MRDIQIIDTAAFMPSGMLPVRPRQVRDQGWLHEQLRAFRRRWSCPSGAVGPSQGPLWHGVR